MHGYKNARFQDMCCNHACSGLPDALILAGHPPPNECFVSCRYSNGGLMIKGLPFLQTLPQSSSESSQSSSGPAAAASQQHGHVAQHFRCTVPKNLNLSTSQYAHRIVQMSYTDMPYTDIHMCTDGLRRGTRYPYIGSILQRCHIAGGA